MYNGICSMERNPRQYKIHKITNKASRLQKHKLIIYKHICNKRGGSIRSKLCSYCRSGQYIFTCFKKRPPYNNSTTIKMLQNIRQNGRPD